MTKSTAKRASRKPKKPRPDFPLFPHQTGRWAKKVRGKLRYFGKIETDPNGEAALNLWLEQRDELLAGRTPRPKSDSFTLRALCNAFLAAKELQRDSGELSPRTFAEYKATALRLGAEMGVDRPVDDLRPEDFEKYRAAIAKKWGPVRLGNEVQRVRTIFKYGIEAGLLDRVVRFGPQFKKPSRKVLRIERAKKGERLFTPAELRKLITAAGIPLKAMILLGINCGFGNSDCGSLPIAAIDLKAGWINFPRPKTGIPRRCKLWKETAAALTAAIKKRPTPKDAADQGLAFVTKYGLAWAKTEADSPISKETRKLLDELGIYRPGLSFYTLRHSFATVGGETADQVAVNAIMGHVDDAISAVYRERVSDERLERVAQHVRSWLFSKSAKKR